jgi:hypothetical protein
MPVATAKRFADKIAAHAVLAALALSCFRRGQDRSKMAS